MATGLTVEKVLKMHTEKISLLMYHLLKNSYKNSDTLKELIGLRNLETIDDDLYLLTKVDTDFEFDSFYINMALCICYLRGHDGYPGGEFNKDLHKIEFWIEIKALMLMLSLYTEEMKETSKEIKKYTDY